MSTQKRKRTEFTLKEKKEIIDAAKEEPNQTKLARKMSKKWGIEVKRTTVKGILSKKDAIEAAIKIGVPSGRMKLTQARDPKLDESVFMWVKQAGEQNLPVSGGLIKEKAMKLAVHSPKFTASDGWLDNFKRRHGIKLRNRFGKSKFSEEIQIEPKIELVTEESEDEGVTAPKEELYLFQEALRACSTIRKFMEQRSGKLSVLQACDQLDNEMEEIRQKIQRPVECFGLSDE